MRRRPSSAAFTPGQILILVLVAMLGAVVLFLAALLVLSPDNIDAAQTGSASSGNIPAVMPPVSPSPSPTENVTQAPVEHLAEAVPAACAQQSTEVRRGTITRIIDESTVEILLDGENIQVAFAGIRVSPGQPGNTAVQKISELAAGRDILLVKDATEQDSSGRLVRYLFAGDTFINYELVRAGLAQLLPDSPDRACLSLFEQAEEFARDEKLGLWKPTPVPTRTFMPMVSLAPNTACECSKRPVCADFNTREQAQACFNACQDYNSLLDEDHDGLACEHLP